jgi:hypothetical protein
VETVSHPIWLYCCRFESCPDYKKLKQIDMGFDEEKEWDRLWIKHRNAMINMLICGVILGWCIGIYC